MTVADHDIHSAPGRGAVEQIARWAIADRPDVWATEPAGAAAVEAAAHGSPHEFRVALADLAAHTGPGSPARDLLAAIWGNGDAAQLALGDHEDLRALYRTAAHRSVGLDVAEIATTHGLTLRAEASGEDYQTQVLVESAPGHHDVLTSRTVATPSAGEALRAAALLEHEANGLDDYDLRLIVVQLDRLEQLIASGRRPTEREEPAGVAAERATAHANLQRSEQVRDELRRDLPGTLPAWPAPTVRHAVAASHRSDAEFRSALQELIVVTEARGDRYQATHTHAQQLLATATDKPQVRHHQPSSAPLADQRSPSERWVQVVDSAVKRDLGGDPGWAMLSGTLDHAEASEWNVAKQLPKLAGHGALSSTDPANDLAYRVMDLEDQCSAATVARPATRGGRSIGPNPTAAARTGARSRPLTRAPTAMTPGGIGPPGWPDGGGTTYGRRNNADRHWESDGRPRVTGDTGRTVGAVLHDRLNASGVRPRQCAVEGRNAAVHARCRVRRPGRTRGRVLPARLARDRPRQGEPALL
jgi:hypothetical protein